MAPSWFHPYDSYRGNMLRGIEAMRQPYDIDITPMGAEKVECIHLCWTPIKGWRESKRYYDFPEVDTTPFPRRSVAAEASPK